MTPEGQIKKDICTYLELKRVFYWVHQAGKIPGRRLLRTGISDIIGIYKGRPMAIEVKAVKAKPTEEQVKFLEDFARAGGIAAVIRSVDQLERLLSEVDKESA